MERLIDGGLNIWTSASVLTHWSKSEAGTSAVARVLPDDVHEGAYSCGLYVDGSDSEVYITQSVYLVQSRKYRLSFWYKMSASGKTAGVIFRDSSSTVYLRETGGLLGSYYRIVLPNSREWKKVEILFTAHGDYDLYSLFLANYLTASATVMFDDVSLVPVDNPCGFLIDNRWDSGTLTASSAATNFPASFTRHRWHKKPWLSTACAAEWLKLDRAADATGIQALVLRGNNLTTAATLKFQAHASDSWGAPTFDKQIYLFNQELALYTWPIAKDFRWWRLSFVDAANPDTYVTAGRVYLGPIWTPARNFMSGGGFSGFINPSVLSESENGQDSTIERINYSKLDINFKGLQQADFGVLYALAHASEKTKRFFFCTDLGDPWNEMYYVRLDGMTFGRPTPGYFNVGLSLTELR